MEGLEGRIVGGRYRILSVLGSGGFGTVCKVQHVTLERLYALKILHRQFQSDKRIVRRFEREAKAVCRIGHRNIVEVFDFGDDPDLGYYFVMEYLDGETLQAHLKRVGRMDLAAALPILQEVISAIEAAHQCSMVHRDIKPENVFLVANRDGTTTAKLLDFGLVTAVEDPSTEWMTRTHSPIGTPTYMAPEQAEGLPVDHRTDIYSLGVMMYRMLAGRPPFTGTTALAILAKHQTERVPAFSEIEPALDVPREVEEIVLKCLEKDPAKRFQATRQLFESLAVAADHADLKTTVALHPVHAWAIQHAPSLATGSRSRRIALAAAGVAVGLVMLAIGAYAFLGPGKLPHPVPDDGFATPEVIEFQDAARDATQPAPEAARPEAVSDPSPAAGTKCTLKFDSRPSGVEVYIKGERKPRVRTPDPLVLDCDVVPPELEFRLKGYITQTVPVSRVELKEKGETLVTVEMNRPRGDFLNRGILKP